MYNISAEASMASGRVEAGPPILKTLSSPQSGEGFCPLTPPTAPARPPVRFRESLAPLGNVKKHVCFFNVSAYGPPRIPQGPSKDPQGPLRDLPGPPQGPPRPPKAAPKAPEGSPMPSQEAPNAQNITKTHKMSKFS